MNFFFFPECPACAELSYKICSEKIFATTSNVQFFAYLCLPQRKKRKKEEINFSFVKICTGSKDYVTPQNTVANCH